MATTMDENYDDLDDDGGLSGFWILVIFLIVLAAFAGIVAIAYQKRPLGTLAAEENLPMVTANPDPGRTEVALQPADPGRQEVIDELNSTEPTRVVNQINPDRDALDGFRTADAGTSTSSSAETLGASRPPGQPPAPRQTTQPTERTQIPQPEPTRQPTQPVQTRPDPEPVQVQPTRPAAATTQPAAAAAPGTHTIQVGAFGTQDEAMEVYGRLVQRLGPLVADHRPVVQYAQVNGRDYHRLLIGSFQGREAAQAVCTQLKGRGQDCLVKAKS